MRPRTTRAAVVLVTIAAVAGAGVAWANREDTPAATWSSTGLPYLERDAGGIVVRFGPGSYAVAEASASDDFDLRVQSIAATADSAIAALAVPGRNDGRTRLVEVPAHGEPRTVAREVFGMALADQRGHLAAWTLPVTEGRWQVVAYDTDQRTTTATLDVPPGSSVAAVEGRQVYLYVEGDAPNGVWTVDAGRRIEPLPGLVPGNGFLMDASATGGFLAGTDTGTVLFDPAGRVVHEFGADLFGTFSPDGSWVALVSADPMSPGYDVRSFDTDDEVDLPLPDGVEPSRLRWTPDGDLLVRTFAGEDDEGSAHDELCTVPSGECADLGELSAEVTDLLDSSAWGQAMLTSPRD
jgi:hypothetical protein